MGKGKNGKWENGKRKSGKKNDWKNGKKKIGRMEKERWGI